MNDESKISNDHLRRRAFVYVRQSTANQVERNRESTDRQYDLVNRAIALGWSRKTVDVIDEDLGVSGSGFSERSGFAKMTAQVALGHAGIVLGLEVSRLARNNADWYRLLDLCSVTNTLIGDADGIYHPSLFNDRLVLGLKGTMSEAELHVLRARLNGGIRNKAARGELRRGLPIGLVWGDGDGEVLIHPDEAVSGAIRIVFERFAEMGSARRVWLWFCSKRILFPLQTNPLKELLWVKPTYTKIHQVLTNPVYAGAYVYGKTRQETYVDENGNVRKRVKKKPRSEWLVFIRDHHEGFIDWETFEANEKRIGKNTKPRRHEAGSGAVREGAAILQGIAVCGRCGRKMRVYYSGRTSTPGYYCPGKTIANGRGQYCLRLSGQKVAKAVSSAFIAALAPAGLQASILAAEQLEANHDAALSQWRRQVERAEYEASRAERRYRAVDPENRLVARGLESQWEKHLSAIEDAKKELVQREQVCSRTLTKTERELILSLGNHLDKVWLAETTTDRDRKELLRTLLEEVIISVDKETRLAHLALRWHGGLIEELDVDLGGKRTPAVCTDEDTIDLMRRLAVHYKDPVIAGILNRQGRRTATGLRYTANRVGSLRTHWKIPCFTNSDESKDGELMNVRQAAKVLNITPSTLHRWLNDGFIAGEQITPGAPWRICVDEKLKSRFVEEAPQGYVVMQDATRILGVSRQTVLQRVKRGELDAVHLRCGRRKGLRIGIPDQDPGLFDQQSSARG